MLRIFFYAALIISYDINHKDRFAKADYFKARSVSIDLSGSKMMFLKAIYLVAF
jgi:hypothetical protein